MIFSPAFVTELTVTPLRHLFKNFAPEDLKWDEDVKKTQIEIDSINNFNKIGTQVKPRILFGRGQYAINPTGLTDSMAQSPGPWVAKGAKRDIHFVLITGVSQLLIEATNEGTCERIVDLTSHFLNQMIPMFCDTQGFKNYGMPLNISPCTISKEDKEMFACTINIPWSKEEHWMINSDDIKIKNFLLKLDLSS